MKIGILGAGAVGESFARAVLAQGHQVMLSSRTPDSADMQNRIASLGEHAHAGTVSQTIAYGDVIALALRPDAIGDVAKQGDWTGKIVIDMSNQFGTSQPTGQITAQTLTGAHVIKAFNTIGAEHYVNPIFDGEKATMFIAGDDAHAKQVVTELTTQLGFDVVNVGGLADSGHLDALARLWVHLAMRGGLGRNFALRLIQQK
jgi:hypothetical protein